MEITRETIHNANAALTSCETSEQARDIWKPIAEALIETQCPAHREQEADELGCDYVGATVEGDLVAWGQEHPLGGDESFREFAIV